MITISDFFGWVGVTVSIIFFASPITKYIQLLKKKIDYREINIIIIIGNYISSIVWLIYGFQIEIQQIKVCYSIGSLISLIWIWIYLVQMGKAKMRQTLIFTMILTSSTFALLIVLIGIINDKKVIGEICFIVCSLSYISPTQLLIKVLNSKDYKKIPIYSAIISAVGYFSWSLFGLFNFSATIIIPNMVGLGFALAQIILYKVYKDKKPLAEEIGNISTTVIGAMKNVVEKTVEIANSINPENGQENKDNNAAPTNTNTNVEPATNIEVFNVDNNNFNFNNSVGIKDNSDNNNILKQNNNNETNNSMNFNTNLETNNSGVNDQNNFENNINDNENKDIPNV
jgi:solute carrier family 50 protein (sugar transporter)